jgi:predicted TIM-barrel fold metal-dependent hydrolase
MIIDIHTHFWGKGYIPSAFHMTTAEAWASQAPDRDPRMIFPKIEKGLIDLDGKLFIDNMDRARVDASFIMAADFGVHWCGEEPSTPLEEQLQNYAALMEKYPGRIYAFAFADPRRRDAIDLFERAVVEWGFKGCGEFTCKGLSVADDAVQPLLKKCVELDVPILVHTRATSGTEAQSDFTEKNVSHPDYILTVRRKYPDLKVIISHVGYPVWWERSAYIASKHANCYLDISNWDRDTSDPETLIPKLAAMRDMAGADRMCFGTDQNSGKRHCGENSVLARWISFIRKLPEIAPEYGYRFSQEEIDLILGGSAQKLFDL